VTALIANVFENDKRFIQEFKESVDAILSMFKRSFTASLKITDMIRGDMIIERTRSEQDEVIKRIMLDYAEIMTNLELTCEYFPESMLETVRNTSLPLFCANIYCLMTGHVKKQWLQQSLIREELEVIRKQVKKLAVKTCLIIIDVSIVKCISKHSISYAVVQDRLASSLKQFILGVTGNVELSKDQLHKNSNFMVENSTGSRFLKKVLEKVNPATGTYEVDFVKVLYEFEERFLSLKDRDLLLSIL